MMNHPTAGDDDRTTAAIQRYLNDLRRFPATLLPSRSSAT
jgi:hypothetical protein